MQQYFAILLLTSIFVVTGCRQKSTKVGSAGLRSASYSPKIKAEDVIVKNESGEAKFYLKHGGEQFPILSMDRQKDTESGLKALDSGSNFKITWKNIEIGKGLAGGEGKICTDAYDSVCDAQFAGDPDDLTNKPLELYLSLRQSRKNNQDGGSGDRRSGSVGMVCDSGDSSVIDLSKCAMPQINQHSSGTCLYNSTTGIAEWFLNRQTGKMQRLSPLDVLARLDETAGRNVGESGAINATQSLGGILPDSVSPAQAAFDQSAALGGNEFANLKNKAAELANHTGERVTIPTIKGSTCFMHGSPATSQFDNGRASNEEMQKLINWLKIKRTPIHFFAYYGQIWHAIILLGYDQQRDMLLIKDSLKVTPESGQWVSRATYQAVTYGAVATSEDGSSCDEPVGPDHASAFNDKGGDGGSSGGGSSGGGSTGSDKTTGGSSGGGSSGGGSGKMTAYKIGSSAFSTTIASYNNQLMMFIYATAPVSSIEILGSDGAFYPAVYSFPSQTGWQQIVSVPIQSTWCSKSNVTIRVDGSSQGQVPLDDKQGCK